MKKKLFFDFVSSIIVVLVAGTIFAGIDLLSALIGAGGYVWFIFATPVTIDEIPSSKIDRHFTRTVLITPELARELLRNNKQNRRIRQSKVDYLAKQMWEGKWRITGETIKISTDGRLIDGQHRLLAIIKSGKSYYFDVCYDLRFEIFKVIDGQGKRTVRDVFYINGIKNEASKSSGINRYVTLKNNALFKKESIEELGISSDDILDIYNENPNFWDKLYTDVSLFRKTKIISTTECISYTAYLTKDKQHDYNKVISFLRQVSSGKDIQNDTIRLFRDRIISGMITRNIVSKTIKYSLFVKTWNCFISGKTLKNLYYNPDVEQRPTFI